MQKGNRDDKVDAFVRTCQEHKLKITPQRVTIYRELIDLDVHPTADAVYEALKPGNSIIGPGIIEAKDTTFVIETEWRFMMDAYHNGVLERV